jgi:NarL family two-component system sensor histidine kinase LiaS
MDWLRRIFARLRWKLMAAYALFTTVAVVGLIFVLMTIQAYQLIYKREFLGQWYFRATLRDAAETLRPLLDEDPVRPEALDEKLAGLLQLDGPRVGDLHAPPLRPRNTGILAVFDSSGRVLAVRPAAAVEVGASLRQAVPASGDVVINDVLFRSTVTGTSEPPAAERDPDTRRLFVGVPVRSVDGTVRGGILLRYDPNLRDLLGHGLPVTLIPVGVVLTLVIAVAVVATAFGLLTARWITRRLDRFVTTAESWSRADFSRSIDDTSRDELGGLARNLNRMADQLRTHFETRTELAAIEERHRVARDLHDAVKQQVFAAGMQIGAARERLRTGRGDAAEPLTRAERLTQDAGRELTRLIRELRPAALEGKGLAEAIRELSRDWSLRHGIRAEVRVRGERATPLETEQALFRVAQEALNNVARHSGAGRVELELTWEERALTLRVADDGRGFDDRPGGAGSGIRNMRERVEALGGTFEAGGGAAGGVVRAACPAPAGGSIRPGTSPGGSAEGAQEGAR